MTFAKYIDTERVEIAPRKIKTPYLIAFNFNENEELMKQEGYYQLVEKNKPKDVESEGFYAKPTYKLKNDYIEVTYHAEKINEEE